MRTLLFFLICTLMCATSFGQGLPDIHPNKRTEHPKLRDDRHRRIDRPRHHDHKHNKDIRQHPHVKKDGEHRGGRRGRR